MEERIKENREAIKSMNSRLWALLVAALAQLVGITLLLAGKLI